MQSIANSRCCHAFATFSAYSTGFLYSTSGLGQIIGVIGALVMAILGSFYRYLDRREESENCGLLKSSDSAESAKKCFKYARNLLISAIPVIGAIIVIYRTTHKAERL